MLYYLYYFNILLYTTPTTRSGHSRRGRDGLISGKEGCGMEYSDFLRDVMEMGFIEDEETAGAAVKMVLSILTSRMEAPMAHMLTEHLPPQLSYDNLHAHQGPVVIISVVEMVTRIAARFQLSHDQATALVNRVIRDVRDAAGMDTIEEMVKTMPGDWAALLRSAAVPTNA
jgi:uncharacterized protein (DUF2267 family)